MLTHLSAPLGGARCLYVPDGEQKSGSASTSVNQARRKGLPVETFRRGMLSSYAFASDSERLFLL